MNAQLWIHSLLVAISCAIGITGSPALAGDFEDTKALAAALKVESFRIEQIPGKPLATLKPSADDASDMAKSWSAIIQKPYASKTMGSTPLILVEDIESQNPLGKRIDQISFSEKTFPEILTLVSATAGVAIGMPGLVLGRRSSKMEVRISGDYAKATVREILQDAAKKAGFTKAYVSFAMEIPKDKVVPAIGRKLKKAATTQPASVAEELSAVGWVLAIENGMVCPMLAVW